MLLLYNLFSTLALIIYLPILFLRCVKKGDLRYIKERLGLAEYQKTDVWVHAVSVGETMACIPLLKRLKREYPQKEITLSTTTRTGQKLAMERFPEAQRIMYMPLDAGICIKRVVNSLGPRVFITVETELWPMLFHCLKGIGTNIVLINGRLSNNSFRWYRRIKPFMKRVLSYVDHFYMQSEEDTQRITSLGAERVTVMGNIKFDIEMDAPKPPEWSKNLKNKTILAGSTHKGEEEIILNAYEVIKGELGDVSLILAPRHPERFDEVEGILKKRGFDYIRRTTIDLSGDKRYDIVLLDTIGELSRTFSIATIAFIGGSLLPYGGHNILEPAYWGKPIIFGQCMDNFPFAKDFINESAAIMVKGQKEMIERISELLNNPEMAKRMGQKARAIIDRNRGATERVMELIRGIINDT